MYAFDSQRIVCGPQNTVSGMVNAAVNEEKNVLVSLCSVLAFHSLVLCNKPKSKITWTDDCPGNLAQQKWLCIQVVILAITKGNSTNPSPSRRRNREYWMGLIKVSLNPLVLEWMDGTPFDFEIWVNNEPDSSALCIRMKSFKFADFWCDRNKYFICEQGESYTLFAH